MIRLYQDLFDPTLKTVLSVSTKHVFSGRRAEMGAARGGGGDLGVCEDRALNPNEQNNKYNAIIKSSIISSSVELIRISDYAIFSCKFQFLK